MYSSEKQMSYNDTIGQRRTNSYLAFAILATVVTIVICLVVLVLRKRIQLVIALFKEAGKALSNMPLLLLEPILVNGFHSTSSHIFNHNLMKKNYFNFQDIFGIGFSRWSVVVFSHLD